MSENQIIEIETKLSYQEELVNTLNEIVTKQQKQIDQLELTCKTLIDRIADMAAAGDAQTAPSLLDEKPPHY